MKVLIIQQKMIGDVLTSTILFEILKEHYPTSELHFLVNTGTIPVVQNNPLIDKIVEFTVEMNSDKKAFKQLRENIKAEKYDVVIDAYSKISSAWIAKTSGAKYRISYNKWYTAVAYSHTVQRQTLSLSAAGLAIENRYKLLQPLLDVEHSRRQPKIYLTSQEKEDAKALLVNSGVNFNEKIYMISVLGSDTFKTYPLAYMAVLLDYLVKTTNATLLFNYIPAQEKDAKKLYQLCTPKTQKAIRLDIFGKSLRSFIALTSQCDALIGNEGGAVNMAKAISIPTFSIFCPWIKKGSWNIYEDGLKNVSVHLFDYIDYHPHFSNKKSAKSKAATQYQKFEPSFIIPKLHEFVTGEIITPQEQEYSATVITFNEEKNIARCIESLLPVTKDIVILDSFSTDKTQEICERYPVRFEQQAFEGHIQQKNAAIDLAKNNRIISLDADEALSKELQASILRLKNNWDCNGYLAQRYNNYCGQWIQFSGWNPDRKLRVFDRRYARWGGINPHDTIQLGEKCKKKVIEGSILHWVHTSYEQHSLKVHKFSTIAAKEYYDLGRKSTIAEIILKPTWTFFKGYIFRLGILDGFNGFVICTFSAYTTFLKYLKLRQLIKNNSKINS
ncbi:hypothetical protein SCB49_14100 [unidentified eubacterium SCB49]|nr:hypothetical protein SCB49_14100 [unidentified eubacterium SCB49]